MSAKQLNFNVLSSTERKVLGALLLLANNDLMVNVTRKELAETMGYKSTGGQITLGLKMLDIKNYITQLNQNEYKILI